MLRAASIDGGKALRSVIDEIFGGAPRCSAAARKAVQRAETLPMTEAAQTWAVMIAAHKLKPKQGSARVIKQAECRVTSMPDAAALLHEDLQETRRGDPGLSCLCAQRGVGGLAEDNPRGSVVARLLLGPHSLVDAGFL